MLFYCDGFFIAMRNNSSWKSFHPVVTEVGASSRSQVGGGGEAELQGVGVGAVCRSEETTELTTCWVALIY